VGDQGQLILVYRTQKTFLWGTQGALWMKTKLAASTGTSWGVEAQDQRAGGVVPRNWVGPKHTKKKKNKKR